jgi:hypothetical protein
MIYYLMHKNTPVAMVDITPDGSMAKIGRKMIPELLPLQDRRSERGLISWWRDRAIPIGQGRIESILKRRGIISPGDYLVRNLGLSLTDTYWIKPLNAAYGWDDVNLFDNEFRDNILLRHPDRVGETGSYSPNSSLQGELEKTWVIENGVRRLIKGNHGELSTESINEYLISHAHREQGWTEYVDYELIHIIGKDYRYGCVSDLFTTKNLELVSAYSVISSEVKPNHLSSYEHFVAICVRNGLDEDYVRSFLDYQAKMDYVFSNRDRHLNNFAVLRDTETLQFKSMAPIYDSGKSMLAGKDIIKVTDRYIDRLEANGLAQSEKKMLDLVGTDRCIDLNKLPEPDVLRDTYHMDSKITEERISFMLEIYKRKLDLLDKYMS